MQRNMQDQRTVRGRVLVIGSNSFSGSHFVDKALDAGYEVWGISRSEEPDEAFLPYKRNNEAEARFSFYRLDLNNSMSKIIDIVDSVKPYYIVNFAGQGMVAQSWDNPIDWYKTNLLAQVALHEELRKRDWIKKYIHFTTPEVYGSTGGRIIKEGNNYNPTTPYAVSRAACDMHLMTFFKAYRFPVILTRAANVYGEGQQLYRVIPKAILSARTGKKIVLHGRGESIRSFIHISDVSRALLTLCEYGESGSTWHLSTKEFVSIYQLLGRIARACGVEINDLCETGPERLGKDQEYRLDSSSMRLKHQWSDEIDLDEGIARVVRWVDKNIDFLSRQSWEYCHKG